MPSRATARPAISVAYSRTPSAALSQRCPHKRSHRPHRLFRWPPGAESAARRTAPGSRPPESTAGRGRFFTAGNREKAADYFRQGCDKKCFYIEHGRRVCQLKRGEKTATGTARRATSRTPWPGHSKTGTGRIDSFRANPSCIWPSPGRLVLPRLSFIRSLSPRTSAGTDPIPPDCRRRGARNAVPPDGRPPGRCAPRSPGGRLPPHKKLRPGVIA